MAENISRLSAGSRVPLFVRSKLFVGQMVAVGLIAVGVSGLFCLAVRFRYGDHTLAADQETAYLADLRCADFPDAEEATCAAARLAHRADEIVRVRLGAGVAGLLALAAYVVTRSRLGFGREESLVQRHRFLWLATVSFGLAATLLLSVGSSDDLGFGGVGGYVLIDGGVAVVFFLCSAAMLARTYVADEKPGAGQRR